MSEGIGKPWGIQSNTTRHTRLGFAFQLSTYYLWDGSKFLKMATILCSSFLQESMSLPIERGLMWWLLWPLQWSRSDDVRVADLGYGLALMISATTTMCTRPQLSARDDRHIERTVSIMAEASLDQLLPDNSVADTAFRSKPSPNWNCHAKSRPNCWPTELQTK